MSTLSRALWRELRRRPAQFLSVGLVIALGIGLFTASFDAFLNLTGSYERLYRETRLAHVTAIGGPGGEVPAAGERMPRLVASAGRTVADVPLRPRPDHTLLGRAVGMPPDGRAAVNAIRIVEGEGLDADRPDGVVVERHMAAHFDLSPGDQLDISTPDGWQPLEVLGVAVSPEYLWPARSRQEILVLPDDFGVVFAPEALVAGLDPAALRRETLFRLADDASAEEVEAARRAAIEAGAADAFTIDEQPSNAALQEDVAGFAEMSVMFPAFFLVAAAFATYVLLGRMIAQQQAGIGTLRAFGYRGRTILRTYAAIGVGLGIIGSLAGVVLGALLAELVTRIYTGVLSIPAAVVEVRPSTIAIGLLTGVATGVLAAVVPARSASRISPAAAMRGPLPPSDGGRSTLERLLPPLGRLPVRWLTAVRGLGRARRRSLATIVGVVLSTMLVLVSWGMIDTVQVLLDRQFVDIERHDAQLIVAEGSADEVIEALAGVDGVDDVEAAMTAPVSIAANGRTYSTTLTALEPGATLHRLLGTGGERLPVPVDGVLLGSALRGQLGVEVGGSVSVEIASLLRLEEVPVAGFVDEPLGTNAYASLPGVATALRDALGGLLPAGVSPANLLMLTFEEGVDGSAMRAPLSEVAGVQAFIDSQGLYDLAQELMALFYAFIGVMIVLGGVLAFALIYNTMSANISERQGELAVLRTLGLSRRSIGGLVTLQNLLLTLIGLVPGLILGWLLAAVFMATFSSDMFTFDLQVRPTTFLFTALAILLVGLLSQWPALRAVGRLDLGRIVRDRSF